MGDCVVISEMMKNVMLNLFQHLIKSNSYETLNKFRVTKWYLQHSLWGRVGVDKIGWSPSLLSHPPRRGGMLFKKLFAVPSNSR